MEDSGSHRPEWLQAAGGTGACGIGDRPRDQVGQAVIEHGAGQEQWSHRRFGWGRGGRMSSLIN